MTEDVTKKSCDYSAEAVAEKIEDMLYAYVSAGGSKPYEVYSGLVLCFEQLKTMAAPEASTAKFTFV